MRLRSGIAALAVASVALLGCGGGGDDDAKGDGGTPSGSTEGRTSATLTLTAVGTLDDKIEEPVLTDAGIVAIRRDRLVLISPDDASVRKGSDAEGFGQATAEDPSVSHLVRLEDGRAFAETGIDGECGWSEVDPATLALGQRVATSRETCGKSGLRVRGTSVYWVREDIQVTPTVSYLEKADLAAGTLASVKLADAMPDGYEYTSMVGLVRTPEGDLVVGATKGSDLSAGTLVRIGEDLALTAGDVLTGTPPDWLTGQLLGIAPSAVGGSVWSMQATEAAMSLSLANADGKQLGTTVVPLPEGAKVGLSENLPELAGGEDGVVVVWPVRTDTGSSPEGGITYRTTIYRIDAT